MKTLKALTLLVVAILAPTAVLAETPTAIYDGKSTTIVSIPVIKVGDIAGRGIIYLHLDGTYTYSLVEYDCLAPFSPVSSSWVEACSTRK